MAKTVSFATFNLYNLQLPGRWFRNKKYTKNEYDKKVEWTAEMLNKVDADVIGFQELWARQCLIDVFDKAKLSDRYTLHFIKNDWYDIAVAAAVRKPWVVDNKLVHKVFADEFKLIKRPVVHDNGTTDDEDDDISVDIHEFSRSLLQLSIKHPGHGTDPNIEVFVAHLKSKLATELDAAEKNDPEIKKHADALGDALSTIRRISEAAAFRIILNKLLKNSKTPVVVLGDFNDGVTSNALSLITTQAKYRLYSDSRVGIHSDKGLYSSSIMQNFRSIRDSVYTYAHDGMKDTIDHILFSEQFYDFSKNKLWTFMKMEAWNDHVGDEKPYTSDHGILKTTFVK